jgi:diguanylate cyclase (GGDEF)-like protein/PAS domain S-box-containing protein
MKLPKKLGSGATLILLIAIITILSVAAIFFTSDIFKSLGQYNEHVKENDTVDDALRSLISLNRGMKDVALSRNATDLQTALLSVDKYEASYVTSMDTLLQTDKNDMELIKQIYADFNNWAPIREQVIVLTRAGQHEEAGLITTMTGANQVNLIEGEMDSLMEQIDNRSNAYYQNVQTQNNNVLLYTVCLGGAAIAVAIIISLISRRNRKAYERRLHEEKEYFRVTIQSIEDGVIATDVQQNVQLLNSAAEIMTGWKKEDATGKPFLQVFNISHEDPSESITNPVEEVLQKNITCELSNHAVLSSLDGTRRHVADSAAPIKDITGRTKGVVMVFRDVTEKKRHMDDIKYLSYHDSLTGLYNRAYFEEEIEYIEKSRNLPVSIIMGDVNGLKLTNDLFGHAQGDMLLKTIASVLTQCCRNDDVVARWGGDEFIIALPGTATAGAEEVIKRIHEQCKNTYFGLAREILLPSISLGSATKTKKQEGLLQKLKQAESNMYKAKLLESKGIHSAIINSMKSTLFEKSHETQEHGQRLVHYCRKIGEVLGLDPAKQDDLSLFALLHDIGKITVDNHVLTKPEALNEPEWAEMRKHPETGYRIAISSPELSGIADYILSHHERWDGTGYPQGLAGGDIPLPSRILAVVDAFDAMTNPRPYKNVMSVEQAKEELIQNAGTQFDPKIVDIMLKILAKDSPQ